MKCPGAGHCPGCGDGGGPVVGIAVVVLAIIAIAERHTIEHGADVVARILVITAISAACITVAAVAVAVTVATRRRLNRPAAARPAIMAPVTVVSLGRAERPAIEAPPHGRTPHG